jgi:hypothetical protein
VDLDRETAGMFILRGWRKEAMMERRFMGRILDKK